MKHVVVREHARLTTDSVEGSLDVATVSTSAFDWLCRESSRLRCSGAALVQIEGRHLLRLDNYVGVIQTPCGTCVEVLPKALRDDSSPARGRRILRRMLESCLDVTPRSSAAADIDAFDWPLTEWVSRHFLASLDRLVKRGLRFEYRSRREELRFLRGKIEVAQQMRQSPSRAHLFRVEQDVFDPDRAENRLLRSALDIVCTQAREPGNWQLAHKLAAILASVPSSPSVQQDFRRWSRDRLNAHYKPVRPWCSLILNEQSPFSTLGGWHGTSLLFPMERVYQEFLGRRLERMLAPHAKLKSAPRSMHLCRHRDSDWLMLEPDFLITAGERRWVVDAKWKLLDRGASSPSQKYGLSQGDFYQMAAYARRYMGGRGDMYLIYPQHYAFASSLEVFHLDDELRVWVVPFDIDSGAIEVAGGGLPLVANRAAA